MKDPTSTASALTTVAIMVASNLSAFPFGGKRSGPERHTCAATGKFLLFSLP